jgi:NAD(P)-dependent dehydrogenase (short-subunit alcohol dehydrogenase family)
MSAVPRLAPAPPRLLSRDDVVVITGASRGIGAATARTVAHSGCAVVVNYRRERAAAEQVQQEVQALGGRAIAVRADVGLEDDCARLFDAAADAFGPPTGVVVNAGILAPERRLEHMTVERIERVLRTNLLGALLTVRQAVRHMAPHRGGRGGSVVFVGSAASRTGSAGCYVDYAATKGAMDTLVLGLAKELAEDDIRVNGLRPGWIDTAIHATAGVPDRLDRVAHTVPLGRGGSGDEVAAAIEFLLSNQASYCTGSILDVAGGR